MAKDFDGFVSGFNSLQQLFMLSLSLLFGVDVEGASLEELGQVCGL